MKLHINSECEPGVISIKSVETKRIFVHTDGPLTVFDFYGITYEWTLWSANQWLYLITVSLDDNSSVEFLYLYTLKTGPMPITEDVVEEVKRIFPTAWNIDRITRWCDEQTESVLKHFNQL